MTVTRPAPRGRPLRGPTRSGARQRAFLRAMLALMNLDGDRTAKARAAAAEARRKRADDRARQVAPIVAELQASGARSLRAIARGLNERGTRTPRGNNRIASIRP